MIELYLSEDYSMPPLHLLQLTNVSFQNVKKLTLILDTCCVFSCLWKVRVNMPFVNIDNFEECSFLLSKLGLYKTIIFNALKALRIILQETSAI